MSKKLNYQLGRRVMIANVNRSIDYLNQGLNLGIAKVSMKHSCSHVRKVFDLLAIYKSELITHSYLFY